MGFVRLRISNRLCLSVCLSVCLSACLSLSLSPSLVSSRRSHLHVSDDEQGVEVAGPRYRESLDKNAHGANEGTKARP